MPGDDTATVALAVAEELEFEHVTEYVVVSSGVTTIESDVSPPVLKCVPTHEVALVDDHVRSDDSPLIIESGLATRDAVTAAGGGGVPQDVGIVPPLPLTQEYTLVCTRFEELLSTEFHLQLLP